MKINRHNYEEFFLLYVDNELSSEDRRMVEEFVQLHPDLKEELDMLSHFKFTPDNEIVFDKKEELLKQNGETPLTLNNYEESFLSYIDNELTEEQKTAVEYFADTNPAAQKELELLQRTKLQPETIVFHDKASLYRQEEKVRALPFRWWRAAAAILILALGLTAVLVFTGRSVSDESPVAKNPGTNQTSPEKNKIDQPVKETMADNNKTVETVNPEASSNKEDKPANTPAYVQTNNVAQKENKQTPAVKTPNNPLPVQKEEVVIANNNKPTNNLPTPENNPYVNGDTRAIAKVTLPNEKTEIKNIPAVTNQVAPPSNIIQASYTNNDEELVQNDGKKNKLRGLFRKVARTFEKRTDIDPTDDNRLLVGGFAIKLK